MFEVSGWLKKIKARTAALIGSNNKRTPVVDASTFLMPAKARKFGNTPANMVNPPTATQNCKYNPGSNRTNFGSCQRKDASG